MQIRRLDGTQITNFNQNPAGKASKKTGKMAAKVTRDTYPSTDPSKHSYEMLDSSKNQLGARIHLSD